MTSRMCAKTATSSGGMSVAATLRHASPIANVSGQSDGFPAHDGLEARAAVGGVGDGEEVVSDGDCRPVAYVDAAGGDE